MPRPRRDQSAAIVADHPADLDCPVSGTSNANRAGRRRRYGWRKLRTTFHAFQTETASGIGPVCAVSFPGTLGPDSVATPWKGHAFVRTVFGCRRPDDLESIYLRGGFDAILTIREPARRKSDRVNVIGTQRLEAQVLNSKNPDTRIWSTFEWGTRLPQTKAEKSKSRRLDVISNSLALRRHWAESLGGEVILPGPLRMAESKVSVAAGETRVILVGQSTLPAEFWTRF